jgi:AcrR family transcriptional regulator
MNVIMSSPSPATEPRRPQQARSRERVQRMLDAADHILATDGFEALTIRRIAAEAGVPVGSIYQFFPDKAAIVDHLARAYIADFEALMAGLVDQAGAAVLVDGDLAGLILDAFAEMYRSKPGYLAIWRGRHLSPELQHADDANNARLAEELARLLEAPTGRPADDAELVLACRIAVQVGDALLQLAFRLDPNGDETVLAEAKRLQRLYLADLTGR